VVQGGDNEMTQVAPAIRDLARQIFAHEASEDNRSVSPRSAAPEAFERLRPHLVKFFGLAGYQALLSRALALAARQEPWLGNLHVQVDASLEVAEKHASDESRGMLVFLEQLLGLLVTFVGDALMLRLVQDIWPGATLDLSLNSQTEPREVTP
jgi:hypothetical protein